MHMLMKYIYLLSELIITPQFHNAQILAPLGSYNSEILLYATDLDICQQLTTIIDIVQSKDLNALLNKKTF